MPETVSLREITSKVEKLIAWQTDHDQRDESRFGELYASLDGMTAKVEQLLTLRAEQVGAARAIAELAERRGSRNTWIVAVISAGSAVATLLFQLFVKHA